MVEVIGLDNATRQLMSLQGRLNTSVGRSLVKHGSKMQKRAKKDHRFKSRSGNLERSILSDVKGLVLRFFIENRFTKTKKGSYGVYQHEGTYDSYKKSESAPKLPHSTGSKGLKHDHFMDRAFDLYLDDLEDDINKVITKELKK